MNALLPMLIPALLLGLSLALDCFAISISQGIKTTRWRPVLTLAILFGVFQAGMLLLGHFTGGLIAGLLSKGMNLLAAALLMGIGAKMLIESNQASEDSAEDSQEMTRMRDYLLLSIATSLDALAGGLSLSSLKIDTWLATVMVFGFSFGLAIIGGHFGTRLGERFGQRAEVFGGLVLIVLGLKAMWG